MRKRYNGFTKLQAQIEGRPLEEPHKKVGYPLPTRITCVTSFRNFLNSYLATGDFDQDDLDCSFQWATSPTEELEQFFGELYDDAAAHCSPWVYTFLVDWKAQVNSPDFEVEVRSHAW